MHLDDGAGPPPARRPPDGHVGRRPRRHAVAGAHRRRPSLALRAAESLSARVVDRVALAHQDVLGRAAMPTLVEEWLRAVVGLQDMTEGDAHELLTAATLLAAQLRSGWGPEPLAARQALRLSLLTVLTARADSPVWSQDTAWHAAAVALQGPTGLFTSRRRLRTWEQHLERDGQRQARQLRAQGTAWVAACRDHLHALGVRQ